MTVLTEPLTWSTEDLLRRRVIHVKRVTKALDPRRMELRGLRYGGHVAVTESLVRGLRRQGIQVSLNPQKLRDVTEFVVVLSSKRALRQAIELKRSNRIGTLLAGPNIVEFSDDAESILTDPAIDQVLVPSPWVRSMYLQYEPELNDRVSVWAAGVDTSFWKVGNRPDKRSGSLRILIFVKPKRLREAPINETVSRFKELGFQTSTIVYGHYNRRSFRRKLQEADLLVGFSASETQGIAWTESWSTGTPTLIWKADPLYYRNRMLPSESAPYLSPATGMYFRTIDELDGSMIEDLSLRPRDVSRDWVLRHQTNLISARRLVDLCS